MYAYIYVQYVLSRGGEAFPKTALEFCSYIRYPRVTLYGITIRLKKTFIFAIVELDSYELR